MTDSPIFVQPTDADWQDLGEGVKRRLLCHDEHLMMVEVFVEKGAMGAPHSHPHIQVSRVVSGRFKVTVGDDTVILNPGDSFRVPANVVHGALAIETGVLIDTFSPHREDFLS